MSKKTKRFLFFTGGTDSVLILSMLLKLLTKNKSDELVVVLVANQGMASGQQEKVQRAIGMLVGNLIENNFHNNKGLMSRVSVMVIGQSFGTNPMEGSFNASSEDENGKRVETSINIAQQNQEMRGLMKSICAQELVVLSSVPSLIGFLGTCSNKFYLGACGTDLATTSASKLKKIFDLNMEMMVQMNEENDLDVEMKKSGLESYGRTGGKYFNPDWVPTLHFPLRDLRKADVIMLLNMQEISNYVVDKAEDLIEYHSQQDGFELTALTKVYDKYNRMYRKAVGFPSFVEFIRKPSLDIVYKDEEIKVSEEEVAKDIQKEQMSTMSRGGALLSAIMQSMK